MSLSAEMGEAIELSNREPQTPEMNKLRQSLRRKKPTYVPEASRPHQWQADEEAVRKGKCNFPVRYLGLVEVEESRGMHVCEEAVKKLKISGKKTVKAVLWVSADGLRVVDDKTKVSLYPSTFPGHLPFSVWAEIDDVTLHTQSTRTIPRAFPEDCVYPRWPD